MESQQPTQTTQSQQQNNEVNEIEFLKNAINEATQVNEVNITNKLTQHFTQLIDSKFGELKKLIYGAAINLPGSEIQLQTKPTSEDLAQLALKIFNEKKNQKVTK